MSFPGIRSPFVAAVLVLTQVCSGAAWAGPQRKIAQAAPASVESSKAQTQQAVESLEPMGFTFASEDGSAQGVRALLTNGSDNLRVHVPAQNGIGEYDVISRTTPSDSQIRVAIEVRAGTRRIALQSVTLEGGADSTESRLRMERASRDLSRQIHEHFSSHGSYFLDALISRAHAQHDPVDLVYGAIYMVVGFSMVVCTANALVETPSLPLGRNLYIIVMGAGFAVLGAMIIYDWCQSFTPCRDAIGR